MICINLPIRTISEANTREHWSKVARRAKGQRTYAKLEVLLRRSCLHGIAYPITITLTRIGKRRLDSDNLQRSFKAVRDGVADGIGIDDGDSRLVWLYGQEIGKEYGVRIEIMGAK